MTIERRKAVRVLACAVAFLLLHGICNTVLGSSRQAVSYLFNAAAPLLAIAACVWHARTAPRYMSAAWNLLKTALILWCAGMVLSAWEDLTQQVAPTVSFFSDFVYFMYGAPILLVICSQTHDRRPTVYLYLDGVLVTLASVLTYALIFSAAPFVNQPIDPIPIDRLVFTYHVENIVLACGAALRLLAYRHAPGRRAFYAVLTVFLVVYALFAGLYNELSVAAPDVQAGVRDLLVDIPFLLLAGAVMLLDAPEEPLEESTWDPLALFIDNFSPIFFTAALLGLGFMLMREHFNLGMWAIFVTLAVQSLRSAMLQSRYMRSERSLRQARDKLEQLAQTDALTGIGNRRYFDQMLTLEWQRGKRGHGAALALLMIDIDHFKSLNDAFGHPYGDACLIRIARALRAGLPRGVDLLARYGGEEFAVILPDTAQAGAELVAAKVREAVAQEKIGNAPARGGYVTISIGLTSCPDFSDAGPEKLLAAADRALYQAKQEGRDRAVFAAM